MNGAATAASEHGGDTYEGACPWCGNCRVSEVQVGGWDCLRSIERLEEQTGGGDQPTPANELPVRSPTVPINAKVFCCIPVPFSAAKLPAPVNHWVIPGPHGPIESITSLGLAAPCDLLRWVIPW